MNHLFFAPEQMGDVRFTLDVGGVQYVSTKSTLEKSPTLKKLIAEQQSSENPPFVDRDGFAFQHTLNFLRNGTVHSIEDSSYVEFLILEAGFYGLTKMEAQLSKMLTVSREDLICATNLTTEIRTLIKLVKQCTDKEASTQSTNSAR